MTKTEIIETLESTIVTWSLLSTEPINDAWASLTGEDPMSWKSNLMVRLEMLWFFLHMLDRYAFTIGGPEARATLQDAIVEDAIGEVIIGSFDASHAKKGLDVKEWQSRMVSSSLEEFNEVQYFDYASCTSLGGEKGTDLLREETIVGKLCRRITRQVLAGEFDARLIIVIMRAAVDTLIKSDLKQQVEKACSILR